MHKRQAKDTFSSGKIVHRVLNTCPLDSGLFGTRVTSGSEWPVRSRGGGGEGEGGGWGWRVSEEKSPRASSFCIDWAQFNAVSRRLEERVPSFLLRLSVRLSVLHTVEINLPSAELWTKRGRGFQVGWLTAKQQQTHTETKFPEPKHTTLWDHACFF